MPKPLYTAEARVTGGRADGQGRTSDGQLAVTLRPPKELGGDGDGTNPEQLFAIGYAACFATVLGLVGQRTGDHTADVAIDSRVMLVPQGNGTFKLGVELDVTLPSVDNPEQAADLVRAADQLCPYSHATRGNIDVAFIANGLRTT
ncbi:MAG: organic hydroperoxide resistance protein [Kibdelosporangium sp.]